MLRRLHSLSGVVPIGAFLVVHLWGSATALRGQESYERSVREAHETPYRIVIEVALVLVPLLFHALYGLKLTFEPRQNTATYPYNRNWMYAAQRLTGIVAFIFIVWHMSEYWIPRTTGDVSVESYYPSLCQNLSTTKFGVPLPALGYVFGIGASVFHLANGLWGFCVSWGLTVSRRAQRLSATVFGIAGVLLFAVGANTAIYFATGASVAVLGIPAGSRTAQLTRTCADLAPKNPPPVAPPAAPVPAPAPNPAPTSE